MKTNFQELCQVVTRESCQSQWPWSVIQTSFSWMNHRLVWIQKLEDSCGKSSQESPQKRNNARSFWLLTQWKRQKLCQPNLVSWSMVTSSVLEHRNISSQNTEKGMKLKSKWFHAPSNKSCNTWHKINSRKKMPFKKNNSKDSSLT